MRDRAKWHWRVLEPFEMKKKSEISKEFEMTEKTEVNV